MKQRLLLGLIFITFLIPIYQGINSGWSSWLPGSMSRHRDAVAVAITAVAYKSWQGYASYKSINRTLLEHGLSVNKINQSKNESGNYLDVMKDSVLLQNAFFAASHIKNPESEGLYFSQDEKGMALLYIAAFLLFGIHTQSLFLLFFTIYGVSLLIICISFYKDSAILFFILCITSAINLTANLLPLLPQQDINVIFGNRFLGILAIVPMIHLMLLTVEKVQIKIIGIIFLLIQVLLIYILINARTSILWVLISYAIFYIIYILAKSYLKIPTIQRIKKGSLLVPIFLLIGFFSYQAHQTLGVNSAYFDGRENGSHVFWHSLLTAIHNNPERNIKFDIPDSFPIYDDQVSYYLFYKEIGASKNREDLYLRNDSDWVFRTTSPKLDFKWDRYDQVLKTVAIRTFKTEPLYSIRSLLFEQPKSLLKLLFGSSFYSSLFSMKFLYAYLIISFGLLISKNYSANKKIILTMILFSLTIGALIPTLFAAVAELRLAEIFCISLLDSIFILLIISSIIKPSKKDGGEEIKEHNNEHI